jgi:putative glutamine amidotransferase
LCGTINRSRDAMEFAVAQAAIDANMPVLAICRGMQLLNVLYGGTLYADVPSQRQQATNGQLPPGAVEHRKVDGVDGQHHLIVEPGSLIRRITRATEGPINSAHHQAVDQLANMFTASATSDDGLIEALEWGDAALGGKPFLLAVQWHPERMDWDSPFSLPIARHFVQEAAAYHLLFA